MPLHESKSGIADRTPVNAGKRKERGRDRGVHSFSTDILSVSEEIIPDASLTKVRHLE